jgi:hypothetical protein
MAVPAPADGLIGLGLGGAVRRLLLVVGGLLLLLLMLVVGALQAVKTQAVRDRIAAALSSALGQPVTIGHLGVSLLPSPALTAQAVRVGRSDPGGAADSTAAPGLFVGEVRVVPRLASILPGQPLAVDRVDLTRMLIAVRRDRAGPLGAAGGTRARQRHEQGAAVGLGSLTGPGGRLAIPVTATGTTTAPRYGVDLRAVAKQQLPGELQKVLRTPLQQGLEQLLPGRQ